MNMALVIVGSVVCLMDDTKGTVTAVTKNGWYTVLSDKGITTKVRGKKNLKVCSDVPCVPSKSLSSPRSCASMPEIAMYSKESKVTRAQAAAMRRSYLVSQITKDVPKVHMQDLRVIVADHTDVLKYELLGAPGKLYELPNDELETMLSSSAHFHKAWNYVKSRDSKHLHGASQETKNVIYMAIMHTLDEWTTRTPSPAGTLVHSQNDFAYVGLAKHGILDRWGSYKYNHVTTANSVERRGDSTMLVDVTLRKHCGMQQQIAWLFVVQHNPDLPLRSEEKRLIHYFGTHGPDGMNATT